MALNFSATTEFLLVPLRVDTALDMTTEEYSDYLNDCDGSKLKYKGDDRPILFKLRKSLPYRLAMRLENLKTELVRRQNADGEMVMEPSVKMGFILEDLRYSIIDIINPPHLSDSEKLYFKKDSEGLCHPEIMEFLISTGCQMDLWGCKAVDNSGSDSLKKK